MRRWTSTRQRRSKVMKARRGQRLDVLMLREPTENTEISGSSTSQSELFIVRMWWWWWRADSAGRWLIIVIRTRMWHRTDRVDSWTVTRHNLIMYISCSDTWQTTTPTASVNNLPLYSAEFNHSRYSLAMTSSSRRRDRSVVDGVVSVEHMQQLFHTITKSIFFRNSVNTHFWKVLNCYRMRQQAYASNRFS